MLLSMKIKKGIFRIYIVLSVMWFCFFFIGFLDQGWQYNTGKELLTISLIPLPLYFILKWIAKGFE